MSGKGDKDRTSNRKKYRDEYDRIFGKRELDKMFGAKKLCEDCSAEIPNGNANRKFCDECNKARRRVSTAKWQAKNPEKMSANNKRWIANNREKWLARQRKINNSPEGKAYMKAYREKNKEKIDEYWTEYNQRPEVKARQKAYNNRPEQILKRKQTALENYIPPTCGVCGAVCPRGHSRCYQHSPSENPECRLEYKREWETWKRNNDLRYKLDKIICSGHWRSICLEKKFPEKPTKWERILGYSHVELITRLETNFEEGMEWGNYGRSKEGERVWEISHIVKGHYFDYSTIEDDDFYAYWSLDNLMPRWTDENTDKHITYK